MTIHPLSRRFFARFARWFVPFVCVGALVGRLLLAGAAGADPQITEFMAAGQEIISDEDGAFPDWIEIHNPGPESVNLQGWGLADGETPAENSWIFPQVALQPGEYLVVFASAKNRVELVQPLHTDFRLRSGGERLSLLRPDRSIAQSFVYPVQIPDLSSDPVAFLVVPTPGTSNAGPLQIAAAPLFDHTRGFSVEPFDLTLTTATSGAAIRYTLDGSEPTLGNGESYSVPFRISKTAVVRAAAFLEGGKSSPVVTHTYLFAADIVKQSANGKAPKGWPKSWGLNRVDYGMDRRVAQRGKYRNTIQQDLQDIPSLAVTIDLDDLFDPIDGIYANPDRKGEEWERPMSLEMIRTDGMPGFQSNAGLRIRGGASRDANNPKHSFRVLFRKEYGAPELDYPLFAGSEVTSRFDIRCEQLISWHYSATEEADFLRDIFGRKSQLATGQPAKDGQFVHLYINGMYWGLFNTDERVTGNYGAEHFGDSGDDYDVVKFDAESNFGTGNSAGTIASWRRLFDQGVAGFATNEQYFKVQGLNVDGSRNRDYERLLDVDNLIDYMLVGVYCAASDNPPSGGTQNNWYSIRSRKGDFGYRFFVHDFELAMYGKDDNVVDVEPPPNPFDGLEPGSVNMWHYWQALRQNAEFRLRVADRVQKHFFDGGALTTEACTARWQGLVDEIDRAVVGESARWGDTNGGRGGPFLAKSGSKARGPIDPGPGGGGNGGTPVRPYSRDDWRKAVEAKLTDYFPFRSGNVVEQLRAANLFPAVAAPRLVEGYPLVIENPNAKGDIYYTIDGSDPRRIGGGVSDSATLYAGAISSASIIQVRARILDGETWSPIVETELTPGVDFRGLIVSEIHYHPSETLANGEELEFLELKNTGAVALDLSGARITSGVNYIFPPGTVVAPGAFLVLVRNAEAFAQRYAGVPIHGVYEGRLANEGETLTLVSPAGQEIFSFAYDEDTPWPAAAYGFGFSLATLGGDPAEPESWTSSTQAGGSPGAEDPVRLPPPNVFINEVLANEGSSPGAGEDAIELHNAGAGAVDVSGWFLTDRVATPRKYRIPNGTLIPPGGFVVFRAADFAASGLALHAAGGNLWLISVQPSGELDSYVRPFSFTYQTNGISFGRVVASDGRESFPALSALTLGEPNAAPLVSPLHIDELAYHPPSGDDEFIEISNALIAAAQIGGAVLEGMNYVFPLGATIPPRSRALVVNTDPAAFRAKYEVPESVPIFGPATGALQDNGEKVRLMLPMQVDDEVGYYVFEDFRYNDRRPWPVAAAGFGSTLQRISASDYAAEPASWHAVRLSPGAATRANIAPSVRLTSPADLTDVIPPATVRFAAEADDRDGVVTAVEFLVDQIVVGKDTEAPYEYTWKPTPGLHDLTARAYDDAGGVSESDFVTIDVDAPPGGTGRGLLGEYFPNTIFNGTPMVREDAQINFDWVEFPPMSEIPRKNYSIRWTGKIVARAPGLHHFTIMTAGAMRLYIGDTLVVEGGDEGFKGDVQEIFGTAEFIAGEPVEIRLEYVETDGFAHIELRWDDGERFGSTLVAESQLYLPTQNVDGFDIATASMLPARQVQREFRTQLQATNGQRPFTWSVIDGALPEGVTVASAGLLSGTPTSLGQHEFTVRVTDANSQSAEKTIRLLVIDTLNPQKRPKVEILTPTAGARFAQGEVVEVTGRVQSARPVAEIRYSLNGGIYHQAPGKANFAIRLTEVKGLEAGKNTVRVIARDIDGRESRVVGQGFTRIVDGPLHVSVRGAGSVTPSFLGVTQRRIGQKYTIEATPAPGFIFVQWENLFIADRKLTFEMTEGLRIVAVFEPNPYPALAGHFVGMVGEANLNHSAGGAFDVQLTATGAMTASLRFGGRRYVSKGRFDLFDSFYDFFSDPETGAFINLSLNLVRETKSIDVFISVFQEPNFFEASGTLNRVPWKSGSPCPAASGYSVVLGPGEPPVPAELSSARMIVTKGGQVRFRGMLPDGTPWSGSSRITGTLGAPIYSPLYEKAGSLSGTMTFVAGGGAEALPFWSRPARPEAESFPDGFAGSLPLAASREGATKGPGKKRP